MKGGHGWAGLVLTPPGTEEGRGFEEGHCFCSFCVNSHAISNIPMLTGMEHGLQFAWMDCSSRGHIDMRARSST